MGIASGDRQRLPARAGRGRRGPRTAGLGLALALLAPLVLLAAFPTGAGAWETGYQLKVVEGESTLPEYESIASTSASVPSHAQAVLSIVRDGTTIYRTIGEGGAWLPQVPQTGETVTLESPAGTPIAALVYDGKPALSSSVCAGSADFAGESTAGDTVEGFYERQALQRDPYGRVVGTERVQYGEAQVKTLSAGVFGGDFLQPLELGQDVGAIESIKTLLGNGQTFTYTSEFERPVGACPPPPPPPIAPAPAPAPLLHGTLTLDPVTIARLLRSGWRDQVSINQPGTVLQALYLQDGALPAQAARVSRKHHRKQHAAILLATGKAQASTPATVTVVLHLSSRGRHLLASMKGARVVLLTTLHSTSGATQTLARRPVWLNR